MQGGVAVLEEQPLLWVHRRRLSSRDVECTVISKLTSDHEPAVSHSASNRIRH